eukprot:6180765-Pleurochrysis_carterae.AAC.2
MSLLKILSVALLFPLKSQAGMCVLVVDSPSSCIRRTKRAVIRSLSSLATRLLKPTVVSARKSKRTRRPCFAFCLQPSKLVFRICLPRLQATLRRVCMRWVEGLTREKFSSNSFSTRAIRLE